MTDLAHFNDRLSRVRAIIKAHRDTIRASNISDPETFERAALSWLSDFDRAFDVVGRCAPESVARAYLDFVALGICPDPVMEWGYFARRGDTCRAMLGYKGVIHLLARDPNFHAIDVQCIYEGDTDGAGGEPRVEMGTSPRVLHAVNLNAVREDTDAAPIVGCYAVLHFKAGAPKVEYMARAQVEQVRAESADPAGSVWRNWWAAMARKSVIHRLKKYVVTTQDVARVLAEDEAADAPAPVQAAPGHTESKLDRLEETAGLYGAPKG